MKIRLVYSLFTISLLLVLSLIFSSSSGGRATIALDGNAGAPWESGTTCNTCHNSGAADFGTITETLLILENGNPVTNYEPNKTYQLELTIEAGMGSPDAYGFQLAIADNSELDAGCFSNPSANVTEALALGHTYLEQNATPSTTNVFTIDWTAPAAGTGAVNFYFAGNLVNGNGGISGDLGGAGQVQSLNEGIDFVACPIDDIADFDAATATNDGTINAGEYSGASSGVNSGFGDVIGDNSSLHWNSDASGNVSLGIETGGGNLNDGLVIYIDALPGGFTTTAGFTDVDDYHRAIISGNGYNDGNLCNGGAGVADLTFGAGFEADYAIAFSDNSTASFAGLWELVDGGAHNFIATINFSGAATSYELDGLTMANLGLAAGDAFNYLATYLGPCDGGGAFRSDEFHGLKPNCSLNGNIGVNPFSLEAGDFNTFFSYESCSSLFISEYIEGSVNNKCIEIFNPSTAAVDLAAEGYALLFFFNGLEIIGSNIPLTGTIGPGQTYVLCDDDSEACFLDLADQTSNQNFFNGNDAIKLINNERVIDLIGNIGEDPGTEWSDASCGTQNVTMIRNPSVERGNPSCSDSFLPSNEWTCEAQNYNLDLGKHTSACSPTCGANAMVLAGSTTTTSLVCEDGAWTYYEDPINLGSYIFAIEWDPDGIGCGHNRTAKGNAEVTITVEPNFYSAIAIPEATFSMKRYWDVDLQGATLDGPVNVKFFYDPAEKQEIITAAQDFATANNVDYEPFHWFKIIDAPFVPAANITPPQVVNEIDLNPQTSSDGNIENGITYAQFDGISSFSGGTGATGAGFHSNPLPLELLSFEGYVQKEGNLLKWQTNAEENLSHFEIQVSTDLISFKTIGEEVSKGDENTIQTYEFIDYSAQTGISYYRLKMVFFDQIIEYSNLISLNREKALDLNIFPNPAQSNLEFEFSSSLNESVSIHVLDATGRYIQVQDAELLIGYNRLSMDVSNLPNGMYILELQMENRNLQRKFSILK